MDVDLTDARNNAPMVLAGPPRGGIAQDRLTQPLPIDTSNPSKVYFRDNPFGGFLRALDLSFVNTCNPIRFEVNRTVHTVRARTGSALFGFDRFYSCVTITNRTRPDHLLEGQVESCLFADDFGVKSINGKRVVARPAGGW